MRPLIRYTIGKVSEAGWEILFESVRLMKKVYPEFDLFVCHNKMTRAETTRLGNLGVELVVQDDVVPPFHFLDHDEGKIRNFCWKLIPARLRPHGHELWVDNDIIFRDRLPTIDRWLMMQTVIISSGFNRDYGRFTGLLQNDEPYCAGLFGLPPNFDFEAAIIGACGGQPLTGFDEQGLVALVVSKFFDRLVVPQEEMALLSEMWKPMGIRWFPMGLHFARANRFSDHFCWRLYKASHAP
jgi:hypothetical protein